MGLISWLSKSHYITWEDRIHLRVLGSNTFLTSYADWVRKINAKGNARIKTQTEVMNKNRKDMHMSVKEQTRSKRLNPIKRS